MPSSFGADRYLLTNTGQDAATFEGLVLNAEASLSRLTLLFDAAAIQTDGPAVNRGFHTEENDLGGLGEKAFQGRRRTGTAGPATARRTIRLRLQ